MGVKHLLRMSHIVHFNVTQCSCTQLDEAEALYMRCIAIKERSLGGTHPQVQPPTPLPHASFRQPRPSSLLQSVP